MAITEHSTTSLGDGSFYSGRDHRGGNERLAVDTPGGSESGTIAADSYVSGNESAGKGKMRIYELAKELGLDNRVVILKAQEIGMPGKKSHSNSLSDEEADTLRRALIREAMGGAGEAAVSRPASQQVETQIIRRTSVDSSTGAAHAVVERRQGDVVRRRKSSLDETNDSFAARGESVGTRSGDEGNFRGAFGDSDADIASGTRESSSQSTEPEVSMRPDDLFLSRAEIAERRARQSSDAALAGSQLKEDNVVSEQDTTDFEEHSVGENEDGLEDSDSVIETMSSELAAIIDVRKVDVVTVKSEEDSIATSERISNLDAAVLEVPAVSEQLDQVSDIDTKIGVSHSANQVVQSPEPVKQPVDIAREAFVVRRRSDEPEIGSAGSGIIDPEARGPKVLGKIELPSAKGTKKTGRTADDSRPSAVSTDLDDDDSRSGKKKGKKREISRGDLVDYEGRSGKKGKAGKRGGRDEDFDAIAFDQAARNSTVEMKASKRVIRMTSEVITVGELAHQMSLKAADVIKKLFELGMLATINQPIDKDTATILAEEFNYTIELTGFDEGNVLTVEGIDDEAAMTARPPVVTVMGHVDHGKTSLLDYIRSASVAHKEHGGITQHIGAYTVDLEDGRVITFIDTPGHAAFTAMRARGAEVTDIVILVVAADDGVMPQTIEAINHAKAAGVQVVVAINKMDKAEANPDHVKARLSEFGLQPEEWGGDTLMYPVSAHTGAGIPELLEGIMLVAELKELKANSSCRVKGTILEARQEKGRGTVATVLVQHGVLKVGDIYVCGAESGRVRSMSNFRGEKIDAAGPSTPVEITGLNGVPTAGDELIQVESEAVARQVASARAEQIKRKEALALSGGPISLEEFAKRSKTDEASELNVIVKADVDGSLEAVRDSVVKLTTEKVKVRVLHGAVGGVTESDVQLALASKALIVGFNVRGEPRALAEAESNGIEIRFYRVIYELLDDVKKAMAGLLAPIREEVHLARAEVRDTFSVPKVGVVAGCYVLDGTVKRGAKLRLLRDSIVIHEGSMLALRRFKDDVKEVQSGYECGISFQGFNDVKHGDVIEVFEIQERAATLD